MSDFTLYPAIDLRRGRVVRLQQGRADAETTYGEDPVEIARDFAAQGAKWLHVVNLDGAFGEAGENLAVLRAVCSSVDIPVEFGGGLRSREDVQQAFGRGVSRVIIGTAALRDPELVRSLAAEHGAAVAVGIDARDGMVAVEGWVETSETPAMELARRMVDAGVSRFVYTDIARDGMLVGPDLEGAAKLAETGAGVIASGGVGTLEHVNAAAAQPAVEGLIIGKALYEGRFTVREALEAVKGTRT
ncbi:MAG: 1-(5-phosphoribosyl)-5-[(5-phosphoribosylamino)methylideneamino]imidazole-4-carboxamide isomerase [Planctomycetes bacterium]|nr:1-(5-phosphoribosyl)-5-[(5-phosphoribosylamino)methylideneamino]imidazole-4-carboxamide isomerase [Planctomycetota bacterium]